jgi:molybdopterin converting factor small subunit
MRVFIPRPLHSYTKGVSDLDARGATLAEVVVDLDGRFPGLRFRIIDEQDRLRPHIKLFVGGKLARDLAAPVAEGDEVHIVAALSGG